MEVIWRYLSSLKLANTIHKFGRINAVAKTVFSLPHSNAREEGVVSLLRKTKQHFGSISPDGRYVCLFARYENGQKKVIFGATCGFVGHCKENYLKLQQRASSTMFFSVMAC